MSKQQIIEQIHEMDLKELKEVSGFVEELQAKRTRKKNIMELAGAWSDWPRDEFEAWLAELEDRRSTHETRPDIR